VSRRAPLIVGIVFIVLALLLFFLLVYPTFGEISDTEESLERAEDQEVLLQAELARLQAAQDDLPQLQRQLARFRRAVPPVADLPGLINQLQTAADVSGVDFFAISPGEPTRLPGVQVSEVPAQIQVIGTFFPVDEFLFRLETGHRASKVVNVAVAEGTEGLPQISVSLDVRFYTSDTDAGPGAAVPEPAPSPSPSPSPGASPSPTASPTTPGG
jgi:Tfp pilus assembly protein PilO